MWHSYTVDFGVTRVARVTGLDRAGVEVACAVRPGGHVLQVANGKGETWEQARASALSEAAELWASERPADLVYASARELASTLAPRDLVAPRLWSRDLRVAWVRAKHDPSGAPVFVPAQAIYCPPQGGPPLGPAVFRWSTNGMGAHPVRARAVRHAVLEALERDQLARALPNGWTPRAVATRKIDVSALPLWKQLRDARLEAHVFDLSGEVQVAGAILVDLDRGPVRVAAGYAAGATLAEAVRGALLEAAQSRLTDVHGAREDVSPQEDLEDLIAACAHAKPRPANLQRRGRCSLPSPAAVVELVREPLFVIKIVAPGLRLPELL